ncbi:hypothetical protein NPIL_677621 [Nephila pilipes]|uniref:Uncharacterized protein n=1 Tax=Nephila pilipes TaxID=299642 RepID=A0A8X6PKK1_NEPPI|nr:hypothetical protein NPIL_677621 [Nephila pilipes]
MDHFLVIFHVESHSTPNCSIKEKQENPKCINCNNFGHVASWEECPSFLKLGKGKSTTKTNNRNNTFNSAEIRPNTSYAQALQPKNDQQRAALDGKPAEATSIPKNNNQYLQSESTDDFTIFDAIKELKSFFQLFAGLMGACKQMRNTPDKTDKLNIFFQAICTQV